MVFTLSHEMTHIYWEFSSRARAPLQRERGQVVMQSSARQSLIFTWMK